jgi:predicted enzyme related to lactoylglutathione lyase
MANQQLNAKLVVCSVPTKNTAAARKFYDTLFGGQDFARSLNDKIESYFRPIHQDGLTLSIAKRSDDREPITCFFAVDNLDETVGQLVAAGGKVVVNSTAMPISGPPQAVKVFKDAHMAQHGVQPSNTMGQFVTMLDPDGNYLGLLQLEDSMKPHFNAEPAQRTLSKAQVDELDNWKKNVEPLIT